MYITWCFYTVFQFTVPFIYPSLRNLGWRKTFYWLNYKHHLFWCANKWSHRTHLKTCWRAKTINWNTRISAFSPQAQARWDLILASVYRDMDTDHIYQEIFSPCSQSKKKIRKLKRNSYDMDCPELNFKDSHITSQTYHLWLTCYRIINGNSVTFEFILFCCVFLLNLSQNHDGHTCLYIYCLESEHCRTKHLAEKKCTFVHIHSCQWSSKCPKLN